MESRRRSERVQKESVRVTAFRLRSILMHKLLPAAAAASSTATSSAPSPAAAARTPRSPTPKAEPATATPSTKASTSSSAAAPTNATNGGASSSSASATTPAAPIAPLRRQSSGGGPPRTHKADGIDFAKGEGATGDKTRDKCCELIYDALAQDSGAREFIAFSLCFSHTRATLHLLSFGAKESA